MTNLDVMCTALHEATGILPAYWRSLIVRTVEAKVDIESTELLTELSDHEANGLLNQLRQEKQGILKWVVEAAMKVKREREPISE